VKYDEPACRSERLTSEGRLNLFDITNGELNFVVNAEIRRQDAKRTMLPKRLMVIMVSLVVLVMGSEQVVWQAVVTCLDRPAITDYRSRYLLSCDSLTSTCTDFAFSVFESAFKDFGLPAATL
jgi:hypothetical protein